MAAPEVKFRERSTLFIAFCEIALGRDQLLQEVVKPQDVCVGRERLPVVAAFGNRYAVSL